MSERHIYHYPEHQKHKGWIDDDGQPWDVPERLYGVVDELLSDTTTTEWIIVPEVYPETLDVIAKVHSRDMIMAIQRAAAEATDEFPVKSSYDIDTETNASAIYPGTFDQALAAAETALAAADGLMGDVDRKLTIALSRPPGHHAGSDFYHGFCYFNNAAIAAEALKESGKKVAILDIDVHHGDGTQDIVGDDPDVLYVSLHADPDELMPHTGYEDETGNGGAEGTVLNLPFAIGVSNEQYSELIERAIEKIRSFGTDVLIIEAGFDGHAREWPELPPLTNLDDDDYASIGSRLGINNLPTLILLGGGYNHEVTPKAFTAFVKGFEDGAGLTGAAVYSSDTALPR